jgi:cation-transporting ATPase E
MNDVPPNDPPTGLSAAEVAERVARGEVNRVRRSDRAEYADIVARNVFTLFNALVVPAAVALFALGEWRDGVAVSGMAITNLVLGLVQEVRGKRHLDKLTLLAEARARVLRDGVVQEIPSGDVVRGDHVLLTAGDTVVADGPVLAARFLEIDEALLTGESDPVPRRPGDELLSGSFCVAGEGAYRADKVGMASFAQSTTQEARAYRYTASPLQDSINRLIRILTTVAVVLCVGYVALFYFRGGFEVRDLVKMIAATITSMVPQGLVLMTTLALILGAVRLSARGAIVQRLSAVEAMASIDTLCMDKTGTLTTNRLRLDRLRLLRTDIPEDEVRDRLRLFASLSIDRSAKTLSAVREALGEAKGELLDQLPFKSQNRYSAVRVRAGGRELVLALGACEALRAYLGSDDGESWESAWRELLGTGLRLLLFAEAAPNGAGRRSFDGSLEGFRLRPLALVALSDEMRPEAAGVLRSLADQGIGFKVLSGDNPETVRATVAPLGAGADSPLLRCLGEAPVVTGSELAAAPEPAELIRTRCVFGRVSPRQKVEIVATLKAQGRRVAMVGDGVNDVLPIKTANLGVAMGDGSRAAKSVAGLVLQTNDFGLLPRTLDEGRTILRNLRRAGKLFLVKNVYMVMLIVGALGVFKLPFPLDPKQVTLLNALTIGAPVLLIMFGRGRATALRSSFVREVGGFALRVGLLIGVAGLTVFWFSARRWDDDTQTQRTMLLATLIPLGLVALLRALADEEGSVRSGERPVLTAAALALPAFLVVMYVPISGSYFALTPLSLTQWGRVLAVAAPAGLVGWVAEWLPWRAARR